MYMDESVLGWRPLAEAWLANRSPQESHVSRYLRSALTDLREEESTLT